MKARLPEEYTNKGMNSMLQQAQQLQVLMDAKQEELKLREYSGSAGGSMVSATVTGEYLVKTIKISPEVAGDSDIEMLEDLVTAALNSAIQAAKEDSETEMATITGGMGLPGLK